MLRKTDIITTFTNVSETYIHFFSLTKNYIILII